MTIELTVEDVMQAPEGLEQAGDEFHDPANWQACPGCDVDCPIESTTCFNCKRSLEGSR